MEELSYWIFMQMCVGKNNPFVDEFLFHYGSARKFFNTSMSKFNFMNRNKNITYSNKEKFLDKSHNIVEDTYSKGYRIVPWNSKNYPALLRNIPSPPIVLYTTGDIGFLNNSLTISIVGTRKATSYGIKVTDKFAYELAQKGVVIVSGMAEGIDSAALNGAMKTGRRVVSVLANGLDVVYPACNAILRKKVENIGVVITEYPLGTAPEKGNFRERNRIISGMSLGTLVTEAPLKSGALITAEYSVLQGREVYLIPADIFRENSQGALKYANDGAKFVTCVNDIIIDHCSLMDINDPYIEFGNKFVQNINFSSNDFDERLVETDYKTKKKPTPKTEKKDTNAQIFNYKIENIKKEIIDKNMLLIYNSICENINNIDSIIEKTGLPGNVVLSLLTEMEISGYIEKLPGNNYGLI